MELFMLIAGIVLLWKFSSAINAVATSAKVKAEVVSEEIIAESVIQRAENYESWKSELEGKEIKKHEEILKLFKVDK